jgi:hypothetical protein
MNFREVIREPTFEDAARAIFTSQETADAWLAAIEWTLSREEDFGNYELLRVSETGRHIRGMVTEATRFVPAVLVVFREGEQGAVHLLWVGHADQAMGN